MIIVISVLAICGMIFGTIGLVIALIALLEVKAMQKSTHTIQYVEPKADKGLKYDDDGFEILSKKTRAKLEDDGDIFDDETTFGEMQ